MKDPGLIVLGITHRQVRGGEVSEVRGRDVHGVTDAGVTVWGRGVLILIILVQGGGKVKFEV